jgi:hypothetical protein
MTFFCMLSPKGEIKRCPSIHRRLGPDPAAVAVQDALDRGQADARARKLRGFVQALKGPEQFVRIGRVKPRAVVPDKENGLTFQLHPAEFN